MSKPFTILLVALCVAGPAQSQVTVTDQLTSCIKIKDTHEGANDRADAVLTCLEALHYKATASKPPKPPTDLMIFKKPDQYGPFWATYKNRAYRNFEYAKDVHGIVHLRGMMTGCANPKEPIFTLPEGYRPKYRLIFHTLSGGNSSARVDIVKEGHVYYDSSKSGSKCPTSDWLTLEGLTFQGEH